MTNYSDLVDEYRRKAKQRGMTDEHIEHDIRYFGDAFDPMDRVRVFLKKLDEWLERRTSDQHS